VVIYPLYLINKIIMRYNIHAAIRFRSQGIYGASVQSSYDGGPDGWGYHPVSFKESVRLAKDEQFMWGEDVPEEYYMRALVLRAEGEKVDKARWKKLSHDYRYHYWVLDQDQSDNGGRYY
jgi:hypothetical protein